jgi:hypothetical protein
MSRLLRTLSRQRQTTTPLGFSYQLCRLQSCNRKLQADKATFYLLIDNLSIDNPLMDKFLLEYGCQILAGSAYLC